MFRKLLIANRGEIGLRIMRTCEDIRLPTVAVFSEADRLSPHVRYADEAYLIGPPPARESYLNIDAIIAAAKETRADAIHPGYGFLAENPDFADACAEAGIAFIGPSGEMIRRMGNKLEARATMQRAGVPVVPGGTVQEPAETRRVAKKLGYPVVVKPVAGGGGKGMHVVSGEKELDSSLRVAASEAGSTFGSSEVYLEKFLLPVRHIEIQLIRDRYGKVVHLGERECSLQRRHQKIVEESPSVAVDADLRARMVEAATAAVNTIDYVGVGTVEFLLDREGNFYFLEMNTRLQVEHTVTEQVTGLDMVQDQILVASGMHLAYGQDDIRFSGSAVECRISAEDPYNDFIPSPGVIELLHEPGGPGVRVDTGVSKGFEVPVYYDPLIAKLITWGQTREQAIRRMGRALRHYKILGIRNNIPFLLAIIQHENFQKGDLHTGFLEEHPALFQERPKASAEIAAIAATILEYQGRGMGHKAPQPEGDARGSAWKSAARPRSWDRQWP